MRLIRNQVYPQGYRGFESLPLRPTDLPGPHKMERCPRGRRGTTGNRVCRKVPRVRIPLSPQLFFESCFLLTVGRVRATVTLALGDVKLLNPARPGREQR